MIRRLCVALVLALLASACALSSDAPAPAAAVEAEEGFSPLFNGRDLTGWAYGPGGPSGEGYRVRPDKNGAVIYCTEHDGGNLFTEQQYDDFILRFEFKLTPAANNGIAIRSPMEGRITYDGIEIQVLDDTHEQHAHIRPAQHHGSVYDVVPAKPGHLKPVGEWNQEEIIARGSRITVKLNGVTIVDKDLATITNQRTLAKHPGIKRQTGHIGFLGHGAAVEFRNLRIKPL